MRLLIALAAAVLASQWIAATGEAQSRAKSPPPSARELLRNAKSWGYQLQDLDVGKLARSRYDVLVIDAGDGRAGLTRGEIARLKRKSDGTRRLVIGYLNVGEAEDYRSYWRKEWDRRPPDWLGAENCRWKGDHRVQHWRAEWQDLLFLEGFQGGQAEHLAERQRQRACAQPGRCEQTQAHRVHEGIGDLHRHGRRCNAPVADHVDAEMLADHDQRENADERQAHDLVGNARLLLNHP